MRFIVDQDVYWQTIVELRKWGHEVVTARDLSHLLITRDKDFGTLTFLEEKIYGGIIFLRCSPANLSKVHNELKRLLTEHDEEELNHYFSVVEQNHYRIRRLI